MNLDQALAEARAEAEARMLDTCRIIRDPVSELNEETGKYTEVGTVVYAGKCRMSASTTSGEVDLGGKLTAVTNPTLHLPALTEGVQVGDLVEIIASPTRAAIVGRKFDVTQMFDASQASALRMTTEVTDGRRL